MSILNSRFTSAVISAVIAAFLQASAATTAPDTAANVISFERERTERAKSEIHVIAEGDLAKKAASDSIRNLVDIFYYDQFRHFSDPHAPYFMFLSRNGRLAMGIGGLVRLRGYFDWNGSIPANGFAPYLIPIPKDPTSLRRLSATAAGTGLFFTVLGNHEKAGRYMAFIQADFSGYQYKGFKLKKAYLTVGDWTEGLATSTFEDTAAEPQTIDGSGANGVNSHSTVLVRYMHTFKGRWTVGAGMEFPESQTAADGVYTKACSDWLPDAAAFVQYQWRKGTSHVRLSGLYRTLTYRDLVEGRNHNIPGWAAQLSAVWQMMPRLSVYGIASVGQGHESYTTDLACGSFDLVAEPGEKGKLYAPTAAGFVAGAKYYFLPNLFSDICLSEQRYYPRANPHDGQYKYGLYGAINLYWDVTPRFEVGAEYLAGKRMNFNGTHGNANRVTAMLMLSF